ncbi:hypothetical protein WNY78_05880 [Psychroserpens sp. AS72]|uniref:hypothetical protein n=1 Tax=Psychroserpens sp. AS72 TaxID=3135775 RepID=UPI00317929CB
MKIYKILTLLFFCIALSVSAQEKLTKVSKKIDVTKDVEIDLNTSYVQIEIDTWNKSTLEIEAYIEGEKLSKEELQEALKSWNLKVEGSGSNVTISSDGSHGSWSFSDNENVHFESFEALKALDVLRDIDLGEMPEMPEMPELPEMPEMARLEIPEMPELPELPELPDGITNVSFDSEAYKKDGEAYLERWSKDYPAKNREKMKAWGREMAKVDFSSYEKHMEVWGEKFGKQFGEDYGKKMEAWGEEFGKRFDGEWSKKMEVWGERYGKQMEERAKAMEKRLEAQERMMDKRHEKLEKVHEKRQEALEKRAEHLSKRFEMHGKDVKRTIKIKMPKGAKLNMNVRHGELKMASVIYNLKADISHANLMANHIDGNETSINVSYSPVQVTTWSDGELNLKYVENAHLNTVASLRLNSNSSDMYIDNLTGTAIIDGSFGDLSISNISEAFTILNIILENSEAVIKLPSNTVDYSMYFKGNRSRLNDEITTQQTINNYPNSKNSGKTIVINAKFSEVALKQ